MRGDITKGIVFKPLDEFAVFITQPGDRALMIAMIVIAAFGPLLFQGFLIVFTEFIPTGLLRPGQRFWVMAMSDDR